MGAPTSWGAGARRPVTYQVRAQVVPSPATPLQNAAGHILRSSVTDSYHPIGSPFMRSTMSRTRLSAVVSACAAISALTGKLVITPRGSQEPIWKTGVPK
jgi:hypothetical protein